MKNKLLTLALATSFAFISNSHEGNHSLETYAKIAYANYSDALKGAIDLQSAILAFTSNPTKSSLAAAKKSWLDSRESYLTTEAFRFSNGPIDAEEGWVGKAYGGSGLEGGLEIEINSWPLDENMIDYTIDANGNKTSGNIIDTSKEFTPGGEGAKPVDISVISPESLTELNMDGGEANVSTGYHAIEFLLWGQDQDYSNFMKDGITNGAMIAGQRPLSDFTTAKGADRRKAYLIAAANKLVADLRTVTSAWEPKVNGVKGLYRAALMGNAGNKNIDTKTAIKQITSGMGIFIKSELANERVAVAVLTPSEEDEHSCFSDNTHRDILRNYQGFKNALFGTYKGKKIGESFIDKVPEKQKTKIINLVHTIDKQVAKVDEIAKTKAHFDYQIQTGSPYVKNIVSMKNNMRKLGDKMIAVAKANGVSINEGDVTDSEETKIEN